MPFIKKPSLLRLKQSIVVYRKPPVWVAPRPAWARGVGE